MLLVARDALLHLGGPTFTPGSDPFTKWFGLLFYVPAVCGGVFGLLGGYLTDLFGRRRVLVWSILVYAFSAMAAGYATSVGWLLFWRCCTFVGVCVEFVAAVAWLSELFSDPKQRERVVGYTQAFGSIGGLMVTGAYYIIVTYGDSFPEVRGGHEEFASRPMGKPSGQAQARPDGESPRMLTRASDYGCRAWPTVVNVSFAVVPTVLMAWARSSRSGRGGPLGSLRTVSGSCRTARRSPG